MSDEPTVDRVAAGRSATVSIAGFIAVTATVSLTVSLIVLYGAIMWSSLSGGPPIPLSGIQAAAVLLATFLVCMLMLRSAVRTNRLVGALVGVSGGAAAVFVASSPIALASGVSYYAGPVPWVSLIIALAIVLFALARTGHSTAPGRSTVAMVGLIGSVVVGVLLAASSTLGPTVVSDPLATFTSRLSMASDPLLALVFGCGAGLGCGLWAVRNVRLNSPG